MRGSAELIWFTIVFAVLAVLAVKPEKTMNAIRFVFALGFILFGIMFVLTIANCGIKALLGIKILGSLYC